MGSNGTKKSDERPTAALSRPVGGLVGGRDRGSELWEDQQHPLEEKGVNPHLPGRSSFEKKFRFSVERTCEEKGSPRGMFPHASPRQKRGGVGCYPGKPGAPSGKAAAVAGSAGPGGSGAEVGLGVSSAARGGCAAVARCPGSALGVAACPLRDFQLFPRWGSSEQGWQGVRGVQESFHGGFGWLVGFLLVSCSWCCKSHSV